MSRWSAPGNVLLTGEYHITEEGGLGLAIAAGGRAYSILETASFNKKHRDSAMLRSVRRVLSLPAEETARVDTSAFYSTGGRKWGLGSSAVSALIITRMLSPLSDRKVMEKALAAHRDFQGQQGSGYDIFASAYGGAGIFQGGARPAWRPFSWPKDLKGYLIRGQKAVRSTTALARYNWWSRQFKSLAADFRSRSNALLTEDNTLFPLLAEAARIGVELGDAIGIPAEPRLPPELGPDVLKGTRPDVVAKCAGAGNELVFIFFRQGALLKKEVEALEALVLQDRAKVLTVDHEGLRHEPSIG